MSAPQPTSAANATNAPPAGLETPLPSPQALLTAAKLAIQVDKPIQDGLLCRHLYSQGTFG